MSRKVLLVLAFSVLTISQSLAQESESEVSVKITAIMSETDGTLDLERSIIAEFRRQLKSRDIPWSNRPQESLLIDAREVQIGETTQIVLSITRMQALPNEVISFGAKNEAFYMRASLQDLPVEGKSVRQYMSRSWLEQFQSITDQKLVVIPPEALERTVSDYLDSMFDLYR